MDAFEISADWFVIDNIDLFVAYTTATTSFDESDTDIEEDIIILGAAIRF